MIASFPSFYSFDFFGFTDSELKIATSDKVFYLKLSRKQRKQIKRVLKSLATLKSVVTFMLSCFLPTIRGPFLSLRPVCFLLTINLRHSKDALKAIANGEGEGLKYFYRDFFRFRYPLVFEAFPLCCKPLTFLPALVNPLKALPLPFPSCSSGTFVRSTMMTSNHLKRPSSQTQ